MEGRVPESLIARIWGEQWLVKGGLITSSGESVEVVYPGRPNGDSGPDFRGAIIVTGEGKLVTGDVELHVRSSQWRAHGHHRDPGYNGVILHVAMWDDQKKSTQLQNGQIAPNLALCGCLKGSLAEIGRRASLPLVISEPCHDAGKRLGGLVVGRLLDKAGEERFRLKAASFKKEFATKEAGQVLYEGIMRALGYKKNKQPFQELAQRLPLRDLERLAQGKRGEEQCLTLQSLLLGGAGLLPSQRRNRLVGDRLVAEMEQIWYSSGIPEMVSPAEWRFFRVRPENFPSRRMAAAGHLLSRYLERGLLPGILELVTKSNHQLESGLMVTGNGYWAEHFDFGDRGVAKSPSLIGQGRAAEMVVNVVLPFFFAWAGSGPGLKRHALELYRCHARLAENEVSRQMVGKLLGKEGSQIVNSAQRQQGLMHIFKLFCQERKCTECPFGARQA